MLPLRKLGALIVPQYKFYFLDGNGHIDRAEDHVFDDDLAALNAAEKRCSTHGIEVWQLGRIVVRVKKDNRPLEPDDRTSL